jgi:hypothetical protein
MRKNLRNPAAGTVEGQESLPANVAELVYPDASSRIEETHRSRLKACNAAAEVKNYLDDRAQARYVSVLSILPASIDTVHHRH